MKIKVIIQLLNKICILDHSNKNFETKSNDIYREENGYQRYHNPHGA